MYLATKNRNKDEKAKGVIDFSDVSAEIKAGVYRKVYLIYGDEAYLSDRIVAALRKNLISPGSEAVDYYAFEVKKSSVLSEDIRAQAYTPPFLSARRMVVVRNQGIFTSDFSNVFIKSYPLFIIVLSDRFSASPINKNEVLSYSILVTTE